ncbi:hypothetical protein LINPERPRIM_LOCUS18229 [Linum perenne]
MSCKLLRFLLLGCLLIVASQHGFFVSAKKVQATGSFQKSLTNNYHMAQNRLEKRRFEKLHPDPTQLEITIHIPSNS